MKTKTKVLMLSLLLLIMMLPLTACDNADTSVLTRPFPSEPSISNDPMPDNPDPVEPTSEPTILPTDMPPAIAMGNTSGNIHNFGRIAIQGDWIYYANMSDEQKLYAIRTDGSDRKKLTDDGVSHINVIEDRIYFLDRANQKIFTVRIDGSDRREFGGSGYQSIHVVGNTIFCVNSYTISRMSTDGEGWERIGDDRATSITVTGDRIFYTGSTDNRGIYAMKTDGSDKVQITDDRASYVIVNGDRIYYANQMESGAIYSVKTDGSDRKKLDAFAGEYTHMNIMGNRIYYSASGFLDGGGIRSINMDGSEKTTVINDGGVGIHAIGDRIYFVTYPDGSDGEIHSIKPDGSDRQILD